MEVQCQRTVLVTAAGGHIGSELIPQLLKHDLKIVLPTSNAMRLQAGLPVIGTADNVTVEEGSIKDPQWVETILAKHNVDTVFLCLTGADELLVAANFLDAMKQRAGGVKHLVYLSQCGDFLSPDGIRQIMSTCSAAHVLVKTAIEQKMAYGGFTWTTTKLGPTLFFTNDERNKVSLLRDGVFAEPLGEKGVSRVSTADIALAACNAILQPEKWAGKKVMLGSLHRYTGSDICRLWAETIGREVRMCDSNTEGMAKWEDEFATATAGALGADVAKAWGRRFRLGYEYVSGYGFGMSEEEYAEQIELLGREPESYEEWVRKTGSSWR